MSKFCWVGLGGGLHTAWTAHIPGSYTATLFFPALFTALAEVLGSKVCLSRDKYNTMYCLESEQVRQCITTDWKAAQVHVLPMMHLSFQVGAAVPFSLETSNLTDLIRKVITPGLKKYTVIRVKQQGYHITLMSHRQFLLIHSSYKPYLFGWT